MLNKNIVVIKDVNEPGAYLIVPIPKKVTNKKFNFLKNLLIYPMKEVKNNQFKSSINNKVNKWYIFLFRYVFD